MSEVRKFVFSDGAENERLYQETVAGLRKLGHPEAAHVLESEQFMLYGNPGAERPTGLVSILCEEVAPPHERQPEEFLNWTGKTLAEVEAAFAIPADILRRSEYLARHPEILEELDGGIQAGASSGLDPWEGAAPPIDGGKP